MIQHDTFDQTTPLSLLPLKNVVLLPKNIIPVVVGRPSSINAVEFALKNNDKSLFVTAQKYPDIEVPTLNDVFHYGTRATILQVMPLPKGALKILVEGINRAHATQAIPQSDFILVETQDIETTGLEDSPELFALWRHLQSLYASYSQLNNKVPADLLANAKSSEDMDYLADTLAIHINLSFSDRQLLIETPNLRERLLKLCAFLQKEIEILEIEERIRGRVQNQVEKNQREYYLTEQMKAIQKELGRDDHASEISIIKQKIKALQLPVEVQEKVERELRRLEQMPPLSSEAAISRHYIEWVVALPWTKTSKDSVSLEEAEDILNKHHAGLKKPKERIIEFIAAKKFSPKLQRSPIICLVGPPGVGKTSLAHSIAESLGREFVRISLGGIRDEAEIRGHRRTYIGALPGKIIQAMRKAETVNPVILLDEIDKMSSDIHGDPASALLEVLDPEQNKSFVDHFLEVEYDLSKVMFIATANHIDGIPYPLYDRMEIITLSGYTEPEKLAIAQQFLLPKALKEHGLKKTQFKIAPELIQKIISSYTKEAGVRQLERVLAKLTRKAIQVLLKDKTAKTIVVSDELLKEWLGNVRFKKSTLSTHTTRIGLATGLAWTEVGGDVMEIEVTIVPGKGGMTLTGQLGDVMQESAHAALSYVRARAHELGLKDSFYSESDIHIHVPEGATPKDGPSAGITICTALVSAFTRTPTKDLVAMTGEITLRGRVLGVGGLKEKLLAAKQHGITTVLVPLENKPDIEEVQSDIGKGLECVYVATMDEVLAHAFDKNPLENPHKAPSEKNGKTNRKNGKNTKIPAKTPKTREKATTRKRANRS